MYIYKAISGNGLISEEQLDNFGSEGWELAFIVHQPEEIGKRKFTYYFKQPKSVN